jgi:hypothetical protein
MTHSGRHLLPPSTVHGIIICNITTWITYVKVTTIVWTHLSCKEHYTSVMVIVREENPWRAVNSFNTQRSWEVTLAPHSILSVRVAGKASSQHTTCVTKEHYFACLCASMAHSFLCRWTNIHHVILSAVIQRLMLYMPLYNITAVFHYITSVHNFYLFMLYLMMMSVAKAM